MEKDYIDLYTLLKKESKYQSHTYNRFYPYRGGCTKSLIDYMFLLKNQWYHKCGTKVLKYIDVADLINQGSKTTGCPMPFILVTMFPWLIKLH